MSRKNLPNGSPNLLRPLFDQTINSDDEMQVSLVQDKSINRMEVEESHFVEKDIVLQGPVKDSTEEEEEEEEEGEGEDSLDENIQEVQLKTYKQMKEGLRSLAPKRPMKKESDSSCYAFLKMFSLLVPLCIIVYSSLVLREQSYQHSTIFANITVELKKRIYGQDQAVEAVGEYLRLDEPTLKVIALVGGTGVGKSYTIEIIESNFPKHSVRRYFPPIGTTMNDVSFFSLLYPKLIVLENLKEHDLAHVVNFLKMREKMSVDQYITVLAAFNVERMDADLTRSMDLDRSASAIKDALASDEDLEIKVVTYEPLGENILEKCIADAAHRSGVVLSVRDIELVKQQLVINNAGCKGAYSKIQVIDRQ